MLLFNLGTLLRDPIAFLVLLIVVAGGVLVALTVHEFGHALTASFLGDPTARRQGRISLNPLRHLDPAGTLMFLVVGFGWGKPVAFDPYRLRYGRRGVALVAGAGPATNFLTAALLAIPVRAGLLDRGIDLGRILDHPAEVTAWASAFFGAAFLFNVLLGVFNLLPIAPLDGFQVALGVLPREMARGLRRVGKYGLILLFGIIGVDIILGTRILGGIISPVTQAVSNLLLGA